MNSWFDLSSILSILSTLCIVLMLVFQREMLNIIPRLLFSCLTNKYFAADAAIYQFAASLIMLPRNKPCILKNKCSKFSRDAYVNFQFRFQSQFSNTIQFNDISECLQIFGYSQVLIIRCVWAEKMGIVLTNIELLFI
ncbi:hypothetical protein BpHYR1_047787 [Brachionus plicatilis]|uniref:Uncharacterized protein n=1 Tax=Brachionus plicatilis TaxID=10195 RepID=A0A3M7QP32_BRAPC|nr:hypothetical protein BpHYR1_047787 [Brachionus plicatilis]